MPLRALHTPECIAVCRVGQDAALAVQNAPSDKRPFLHPILSPDCTAILTEDAPPHHPWQHGLYVGLNDVNGVGFWTEGLHTKENDGSFRPAPLQSPAVRGECAEWSVETEWLAPDKSGMLAETQRWRLTDNRRGAEFVLDLEWKLTARIDLAFGKYAYGGLFLRMPYNPELGGSALNSEGLKNNAAEAQRARWVAVSMPVAAAAGGRAVAGMAIMDHPTNPEHPVPYRVDGQLGIGPSRCIVGAWSLKVGSCATFKHRVLVFNGEADPARVNANWDDWTKNF